MKEVCFRPDDELNVLCLGAHADDIELGCGGTILGLIKRYKKMRFYWVIFSADEKRAREALSSARSFLKGAREKKVEVHNYRESYFPYLGSEIKDAFEKLKTASSPDLVFTHFRKDLHQDHRLISELTWNTFRDHLILEFEILKYDGDLGAPNFFVPLEKKTCQRKIRLLLENFKSQRGKRWFSEEAFSSLMKLRGIESSSESGYAEAFFCRKMVLGFRL
jgi:LmbE family N-acetylglucosaminyl deacetylase